MHPDNLRAMRDVQFDDWRVRISVHRLRTLPGFGDGDRFRPIRGAGEFLDGLRLAATVLGIGTGGWRASAELKLAAAQLDSRMLYATADDAETRIEIFSVARTRAIGDSGEPSATVLVGDSVWDVATARMLRWCFLGVGVGAAATRLHKAGAAVVVPDYADLDATKAIRGAQFPR